MWDTYVIIYIEVIRMSERSDRILKAIKKTGLSYNELAKQTGIPKSALQRYATGETEKIPVDRIEAIARAAGVSYKYITGWRENENTPSNIIPIDDIQFVKIPVIGQVAAGTQCLADMEITDYNYVPSDDIVSGETYVFLRVTGDSMYPDIKENDLVLVKCQNAADNGSIAVVIIDNEDGIVKRVIYGKNFIELQSINPMYPPRRFENDEMTRIHIFGIVKQIKRIL